MTAIGRLWRRAPAWRLTLAAAVAATGLAAMFPPALPRWPFAARPAPAAGGAVPGAAPSARYVPQPDAPPPDYGTIESPPLGAGRSGIVPFAGRQVPLPAGTWQELVLGRSGGADAVQVTVFGRMDARRLTGLMLLAAPDPLSAAAGPVAGPQPCYAADAVAHQIIPAGPNQSLLAHECWTITPFDLTDAAARARQDNVLRAGLDRLDRMGIAVPEHMLGTRFLRSDETGWLTALLLLPDHRGDGPAVLRRLEEWVRRFAPAFHKGFDGTLTAADLPPAVARDPE